MTDATKTVKQLFDEWARSGQADEMEDKHRYAVREALREVALPPNAVILDVGCGNGYVTRALARRLPEATVMGIDISSEMVDLARDLTPDGLFNAVFYHGNIADEALDDERFDLIFSMESMYYQIPVMATVQRLASLLKPGGQFVVVVDYYQENTAVHDWPEKCGVDMELLSAADYVKLLTDAGLESPIQQRIRYPEGEDHEEWMVTEGSLATSAVKSYELTAEEIIDDMESETTEEEASES